MPAVLTTLNPNSAVIDEPDLVLHVIGTGFTADAVIVFNGGDEPTTFVSATEVTTGVKPSTANVAGAFPVKVRQLDGESNELPFTFEALMSPDIIGGFTMASQTEARHAGSFILSEGAGHYSRDNIVVLSGEGRLVAGQVIGKVTATGKYRSADPTNADGSQTAAAILFAPVDATAADAGAVGIVRTAEVNGNLLTYDAGVVDAPTKALQVAALKTAGIIVRDTVSTVPAGLEGDAPAGESLAARGGHEDTRAPAKSRR